MAVHVQLDDAMLWTELTQDGLPGNGTGWKTTAAISGVWIHTVATYGNAMMLVETLQLDERDLFLGQWF